MTFKINQKEGVVMKNKILLVTIAALTSMFLMTFGIQAQTPKASPTPTASNGETNWGGYNITSSIELGVRGLDVDGNHEKYQSDLNYRPGFRIFDSSFFMEDKEGKQKGIDSLLITSSGWGGDPTGFLRINVEKTGLYRFDGQFRRNNHFNYLVNHARQHRYSDTERNYGDFDFTILPQNENFRVRFGSSYSRTEGITTTSVRPFSDEFRLPGDVDISSRDYRVGVDAKLLGFKLSLTQGYRRFTDETFYDLPAPNPGNDTGNLGRLLTYDRIYPIKGHTNWSMLNVQRTFARKFDFTGRYIYSVTDRDSFQQDFFTGRDNSNNIVDNDTVSTMGESKRPQSRGDIGVTYAVTDNFRISNTFTYDTFRITGSANTSETVFSRTAAGVARATTFTNSIYYRITDFERLVNTIEGDYQFNNSFGFNVGYRYTHRDVKLELFNRNLTSAASATNPLLNDDEEENSTNSLIVGTRIKPTRNWSIFADLEYGESDNAFVRLANYNYTNFRIRSRWSHNQWGVNVSAIIRNNENPSTSVLPPANYPAGEFIANSKTRIFSGSVDWSPTYKFSLSSGYTYQHLTSETDIVVPLAVLTRGTSEYFMNDHYLFFDVAAHPFKRFSFYASYRISKDTGQGDRFPTAPQQIISSYPYRLLAPEFRAVVRLHRNIDWNVGYQHFGYTEDIVKTLPPAQFTTTFPVGTVLVPPSQDYTAHMFYTSLRFYFGRKE
jgi:hypothetical protein